MKKMTKEERLSLKLATSEVMKALKNLKKKNAELQNFVQVEKFIPNHNVGEDHFDSEYGFGKIISSEEIDDKLKKMKGFNILVWFPRGSFNSVGSISPVVKEFFVMEREEKFNKPVITITSNKLMNERKRNEKG